MSCLTSLQTAKLPKAYKAEIYLVDDGSTDGTRAAVSEAFPDVKLIEGNGQLFWNRGMHLAWETAAKTADYDFYLWLNDDVLLLPKAMMEIMEASEKNKGAIISGIMASEKSGNITYGGFDFKEKMISPNGQVQACKKFHGNLVLIPKEVYKSIGNLDPHYPHAIGDFDYSLRANKKGIKSFISPSVSGYCEQHDNLPAWCLPDVPLKKRLKTLYSPLGNSHPHYFFYFERRHYGLMVALMHFASIHLRAFFPKLWH